MSAPVACARGSEITVLHDRSQYGCWISGAALHTGPQSPPCLGWTSGSPVVDQHASVCHIQLDREELKLACERGRASDRLVSCRGVLQVCVTNMYTHDPVEYLCLGKGERALILWLGTLKLGEVDLSALYTVLAGGEVRIRTQLVVIQSHGLHPTPGPGRAPFSVPVCGGVTELAALLSHPSPPLQPSPHLLLPVRS